MDCNLGQAQQVSPVGRELERVGKDLTGLEQVLENLEKRICFVLSQNEPTCKEDCEKEVSPNSPIAQEIRTISDRIHNSQRFVQSLISRIQV